MKNCKTKAVLLGLVCAVAGIIAFGIFNSVIHWAGSTSFCGTFCHTMDYAYAGYLQGQHSGTAAGYVAGCSNCHLRYGSEHSVNGFQYIGMLAAKVKAGTTSFIGQVSGTISDYDKQKAHAPELGSAVREWMRSTGFANCRACHDLTKMKNDKRPEIANVHIVLATKNDVDCLGCHLRTGHSYAGLDSQQAVNDVIAGKK